MPGYVRQERTCRATGTPVQVLDLSHEDSVLEAYPGERWATFCVEHGTFVTHPSLELAKWHAPDPRGWCMPCCDILKAEEDAAQARLVADLAAFQALEPWLNT